MVNKCSWTNCNCNAQEDCTLLLAGEVIGTYCRRHFEMVEMVVDRWLQRGDQSSFLVDPDQPPMSTFISQNTPEKICL